MRNEGEKERESGLTSDRGREIEKKRTKLPHQTEIDEEKDASI